MKTILSKEEISGLILSLKKSFRAIHEQRQNELLARHIQFPKIPSILSESIIHNLIQDKKILQELTIDDITSDHKAADIVLHTREGVKKVEVKSTGKSAFQYFGEKDIRADYLIWLHFNTLFADDTTDSFEVFIIQNPARYFIQPLKITLSKMKILVPDLKIEVFKMDSGK